MVKTVIADPITTTTHVTLILGVLKLYLQNRKNHRENIERNKILAYQQQQMWIAFCKEHGLDPTINGVS